jgi:2-iminobutanoate/2-iminopropanoate deaminase
MQPKSFNTTKVPRSNMVIPQASIAGNVIYVSGTTGVDPSTGKLIEGEFEEQIRQAFKNIQTILEEAGSALNKIAKVTVWMVSGEDHSFTAINKVYTEFFPENPPARRAPQVMPFPGGILVSVECVAMV